uniref:Uncharacterized protein n=1 Tax=Anguilla anguilla TaxID=7936 RepID=A0A0E9SIF0_ANGAN
MYTTQVGSSNIIGVDV